MLADGAGPELLDTYQQERLPVGERNRNWALGSWFNHPVNDIAMGLFPGMPAQARQEAFTALFADTEDGAFRRARAREHMKTQKLEFHAQIVELGYAYADGAVVPDGTTAPEKDPLGIDYQPSSRPGERLPHAWLARDGQRILTLDLVRPGRFVLLAGVNAGEWAQAAREVAREGRAAGGRDRTRPGLHAGGRRDPRAGRRRGLAGAPDHHVLWRAGATEDTPRAVLAEALKHAGLGHPAAATAAPA